MVVTAGTANRQAQPGLPGGLHAVDDRLNPPLFGDDAPFTVDTMVSVKTCRNNLITRSFWQHVTGKLFNRELIEREVSIKRVDHPVTPGPVGST